jgi:hypothetical protein
MARAQTPAPPDDEPPAADEPAAPVRPTRIQLQTEMVVIRAQHNALVLRLRRRELVNRARYEANLFNLAHRVRDQLLTASSRHAAILAANAGLAPAILAPALDRIMRAVLTDLHDRYRSAGDPPRQ